MPSDPYTALGVKRDASQQDIQKAYRRLAKKVHPDLHPGNKAAEEQFKEISIAYDLLGDPEKRARFDRGEIDASGQERPAQPFYRDFAERGGHAYSSDAGFADFAGAEDIIAEIFGRQGRGNVRRRGADVHYHLTLSFLDAVNGGKQQLALPDGSSLDVAIPAGIRDGQVLRLRGKGRPGLNGGAAGDDDADDREDDAERGREIARPHARERAHLVLAADQGRAAADPPAGQRTACHGQPRTHAARCTWELHPPGPD